MKGKLKKLLCGALSAAVILSSLPALVFADEGAPYDVTDGLLFNATFDEAGTGTGSFTATTGGTVKENGAVSYTDSWDGKSKALNIASKAAGNYLELADGLLQGKEAATFAFWLKADSPSAPNWPFMNTCEASHTVNTEKYIGMLATTESFTVERYNNTNSRLSSVTAPSTADWQYVVAAFAQDGTRLYSNGKLIASDHVNVNVPALFTADSKTWIGHANWGDGEGFQGSIDDFRIYGRSLSYEEIRTLSADGAKYAADKLINEYNCYLADTHFYMDNTEIYSFMSQNAPTPTTDPQPDEIYVSSPKYSGSGASFTLYNAHSNDASKLAAYIAEYDSEGRLVKVAMDNLADNATSDEVEVTVPFEAANAADDVSVFVWNDMKPVPGSYYAGESVELTDEPPAEDGVLSVSTDISNYTAGRCDVYTELYYIDSDNSENLIAGTSSINIPQAETKNFGITVKNPSDKIPATAKKLVVKVVVADENNVDLTKSTDAGEIYCGVKSPVTAPADSDATTNGAHDPSIVKFPGDDTYYVYSSHHLIFTSTDLINWKKYDFTNINASAISPKTNAFISSNYTNTTMNGTYWAPDVIYREGDDHPYWMYISLSCGLGGRNSAIALEKSDSPLFWADKNADIIDEGVIFATKENNNYKTNAIDANIYTDSNTGKQYFVWGSFWGGIQAAPLTADGHVEGIDYTSDETILSTCQKFGTSIFTQRNGVAGPEGAWMIEHGGNRYAFTSYGWLGSNYNTRVAKSALSTAFNTSNGWNLTDANGVTMYNQQSVGNLSKTTGYKLIGSYRLGGGSRNIVNDTHNFYVESGAGDAITYYGPGHNSVINIGDESFYVSHTRINHPEGAATLQVRKMLWTADGWPVVSPVTYAGETEQALPKDMIVGTYDLASVGQTKMIGTQIGQTGSSAGGIVDLNRNYDIPVLSSKVTLGADGKMTNESGTEIGTWAFNNDHTVTLTFTADGDTSNNKDEFYKSGDVMTLYALFGYDKDEGTPVVGLTGVDENHVTQLAKKNMSSSAVRALPPGKGDAVVIEKSAGGNPILGFDDKGNTLYAGDPAAFVDGDTVYIIAGHDTATNEGYQMPNWVAYSSQDMKTWKYEGVVMEESSISWVNDHVSAWASQAVEYNDKYYLYYCAETKHGSGTNQYNGKSIGVAVADSPTGPYKDIGAPLILGSLTPDSSTWNDIDPTVLIDIDSKGNEHRYLCWGNSKLFICELNEDMTSVKDIDGDNAITFGKDVIEQTVDGAPAAFTEAPWLYRLQRSTGTDMIDRYYLFYAMGWREQMAYATMDSLTNDDGTLNTTWTYGGTLMPPTATSNTNHPAVIDFDGHTYFIYHNGSLPWGSGFRRSVCVEEFDFNDDGSISPIQETSTGLTGTKSYIYHDDGFINYGSFVNPGGDDSYPISRPMYVGGQVTDIKDTQWEIVPGKADENNEYYVSIQAVNKPGLYICADPTKSSNPVTLTQDSKQNDTATKKNMTFKTVAGLNGGGISFESIVSPGFYLTDSNGTLTLSNGSDAAECEFKIKSGDAPVIEMLASVENAWYADGQLHFTLNNAAIYGTVYVSLNGDIGERTPVEVNALTQDVTIDCADIDISEGLTFDIFTEEGRLRYAAETTTVTQFESPYKMPDNYTSYFAFEDNLTDTKGAVSDGTVAPTNIDGTTTAAASYSDGYKGKAVSFSGANGTGVNLGKVITSGKYTVAFRMNANAFTQHTSGIFINSGTKTDESWVSAPIGYQADNTMMIWSKTGGNYIDLISSFKAQTGAWYQVTIAADGGTAKLYIDGAKIGEGNVADIAGANTDTYLGVNFWDTPFNGLIDELYIYNGTTLTDDQVKGLYLGTNAE